MASRARVLSYSVWPLAFLCLLVPIEEEVVDDMPRLRSASDFVSQFT
jgi:hypothetical protein